MRALPVLERELRVAARRPKTYFGRVAAAGVALLFTGYFFWFLSHFAGVTAGRQVFTTLVQFAFVYCLFAGVGNTADCLSREKREGTMGFLFLTHLRSVDIILGKLLATSLSAIYGVVAIVPVLSLCLLTGGVQAGEFWRMMLAIFNALFFSLAMGMAVSACCRQERRATQTTAGIMVIFGLVLPAIGEYLRMKTPQLELGLFLKTLSPAVTLDSSTIPTAGVKYFWMSLLAVHLVAWMGLGLACWLLPFSWQDRVEASRKENWRERWRQRLLGTPQQRRALRSRLLARNPFYWLAARNGQPVLETWTIFFMVILLAAWAGWFFRVIIPVFVMCMITAVTLHAVMKMQICAAACDRLAEDKRNGTLEVLLASPLRVPEILKGQWLALLRQFTWPVLFVGAVCAGMLALVLVLHEPDFTKDSESASNCVMAWAATSLMLLADGVALGWVSMWQALRAKDVMAARSRALFCILFLPWIVLLLILSLIGVSRAMNQWPWAEDLGFAYYLGGWFVLGLTNNLAWALAARARLRARFRILATERFQTKDPRGFDARLNLPFLIPSSSRTATSAG